VDDGKRNMSGRKVGRKKEKIKRKMAQKGGKR
jgi:hypothetical protein